MNKTELIDTLAADGPASGLPRKAIADVLDGLAAAVTLELALPAGEVTLPGIGKLTTAWREARAGRNPATGAPLEIPARRVVRFIPAKALRDALG